MNEWDIIRFIRSSYRQIAMAWTQRIDWVKDANILSLNLELFGIKNLEMKIDYL